MTMIDDRIKTWFDEEVARAPEPLSRSDQR